jgi:hypothetical protein
MPPPHLPHDRAAASAIALVLDAERLARILEPWLPDAGDRTYMVRCIIGEGPIHHRGASYALIALAGAIAERLGLTVSGPDRAGIAVPMRLPPHLERPGEDPLVFPLRLDPSGLDHLAAGHAGVRQVLTDAVTDGPPHHALANVALLNLLAAILRRVESSP